MTASLVLNNQLRFQGSAAYAMVGITSGAILNIGLDPLFDLYSGYGRGRRRLGHHHQPVHQLLPAAGGLRQRGNLASAFSRVQLKLSYYKMIVGGGLPSLGRQGWPPWPPSVSTGPPAPMATPPSRP